jgi:hypothetical protein
VLLPAYRAKNYVPGKEAQSTKVAAAVIELQHMLPMARAVYCSATGVSEVGHMAYMERMGLWGAGSPFPNFEAFLDSMKSRGVSFLEMLAMELKSEGKYVARGLSFQEAEFLYHPCRLTGSQACSSFLCRVPSSHSNQVHAWNWESCLSHAVADAKLEYSLSPRLTGHLCPLLL